MTLPVTTGLHAHFDADALTGLSDNDPVTTWPDESANGLDFTGGSPLYKTGVLNGRPVVRSDGDDELSNTTLGWDIPQPITVFIVWTSNDPDDPSDPNLIGDPDNNGFLVRLKLQSNTTLDLWFGAAAAKIQAIPTDGYDQFVYSTIISDATPNTKVYRENGVEIVNEDDDGTRNWVQGSIFGKGAGNFTISDIAEMIVYSRRLTSQEITDTEAYLSDKWFGVGPHVFFDITDLPADFGNAETAEIVVRTRGQNLSTFLDDFNRADSDSLGADWSEIAGDIDIVSNAAAAQGSGGQRDVAIAQHEQAADMYTEADIATTGNGVKGVIVRSAPDSQDYYYGEVDNANNLLKIIRTEAGSNTELANVGFAISSGWSGHVRLEIVGSDLELFINGVSELTATDPSPITPGNYGGIRAFDGGGNGVTWDNFETGPLPETPLKLYAQLFQSDETTTLSDEVEVASHSSDSSFANTTTTFTGLNTTADKSVWDNARIRFRWGT